MTEPAAEIEKIVCHACYSMLDAGDKFCRYCGKPTGPVEEQPTSTKTASTKPSHPPKHKWADNPWMVLLMLFAVLGPLALPTLWRGNAFGRRGKIVLTVLLVIASVLVIWLCAILLKPIIEQYKEVFRLLEEIRQT